MTGTSNDQGFMEAVAHGDVAQVRALLKMGVAVNQRYWADYPLEAAIRSGNLDVVRAFLESGVDVNFEYGEPEQRNRETALTFAVQCNQPALCRFLLAQGADPNYAQVDKARNEDQTPLEIAIQHNCQEVFEVLLPHTDLSIGRGLHYDGRHIHLACRVGNPDMTRMLLEKGVDVNLRGGVNEITPLHVAVAENHADIVACLLERGADVNARDRRLNVPLHSAKSCEIAQALIAHGADVNAQNDFGETPIFAQRDPQIVELLLENGAQVNIQCNSGETPLHKALTSAAYPYLFDPSGDSRASDKALRVSGEIVARLVAHGADVNAAARKGATPLHYACRDAAVETVALLVQNGADVNARSSGLYDGIPLHIAVEARKYAVCELLVESGADLNAQNSDGDTPLHLAAAGGYKNIAQLLLAGGADVTVAAHDAQTALDIARERRKTHIIKLLGGAPLPGPAPTDKILPAISLDEYKQRLVIPEGLLAYKEALLDSVRPFIDILPYPDDATELWESKFGGLPYLPRDCPYPLDGEGNPLFFLAQINFAETPPLAGFPTGGILAFYIYANYVYSLTADNTRQERFRVLYFEDVTHDDAALTSDFDFLPLFAYPPVERPLGLRFRMDYAPVSNEDYRFEQHIGQPFYTLDAGMTFEEQMAFFKMRRCKLGGYPGSTQDCPIDADNPQQVLLLQISCGEHLTWGDGGLANFFISPVDWLKRDFSRVLYNWNCG
ncbi:MAG TPA: ankyrin repeat domain-containing protein [Anaerolineae bacterium]|nr:ankyrin repeat domain-containing protein [Anaerolineae bacterium]